jgi:hypothetical protein
MAPHLSHDSTLAGATTSHAGGWMPAARGLASVAIVTYLAAVVIPPLAGPPPASALAAALIQPFRPLVGGLHLGHGYRFFAPDPGPGHALRWTMLLRNGSTLTGTIPDRAADRPRLLYHRRFMIPEKIAAFVPPPDAPEEVQREAKREWLPLVKGVAGQLLERYGGTRVELQLVEHYLPLPEEIVRASEPGDAPSMADLIMPLGTYTLAADARP